MASALERLTAEMEADDAPEHAAAPASRVSLSGAVRERRFITIVAVQSDNPLASHVEPIGGRVDRLANGTLLVTWTGAEDPTERTARAARFALLVRDAAPASTIAVATGLHDAVETQPIGQALDRAAALLARGEGSTAPGIRLDAAVAGLLDPRFQIDRSSGDFELLGEEEISTGARTLLGRHSPFTGRERELRGLLDLVDECVRERAPRGPRDGAGRGREVAPRARAPPRARGALRVPRRVAGPRRLHERGLRVRGDRIRAPEHLRRADRRPADRAPALLRGAHRAARARARTRAVTAFLGELAGVPFPDSHCALLEPARRSAAVMTPRILKAWQDFVAAECAAHPVLLVLDDLHWSDTPTVNLLDSTLGALRHSPLFVLALGRPETHDMFPGLWARRDVQAVRLGGLFRGPRRSS